MTLLCIDDDPEDLELFRDAVTSIDSRYTCIIAYDGEDGLKKLSALRPCYIFIDINMPGMDGIETLRLIRQNESFSNIPVCMLSTTISPCDVQRFSTLGATRCVKKPSRFADLCRELNFLSIAKVHTGMLKDSLELQIEIGKRLTELRKLKGYSSHEQFALDHDLPRVHYCRLEEGKTNMTIRTLSKVLVIHGLTIQEFFNK